MSTSSSSYDLVPYRSHPFRQTHPDRLATIATLLGLSPAPIDKCRVLELGGASGGNLTPMADQWPGSRFVGIDASARQINEGRNLIREAGLGNVELCHEDILTFPLEPESFDYIICHGVYSWIPDHVQQRILEICGTCLSRNGVAYLSYNTYPGWHMRGMIRDIMRYRAKFFDSPERQLMQARGLLAFLSESVKVEENPYGMLLKSELESISGSEDYYLMHEHLEENNKPLYFHEFVEQASVHGLQYLGEADFGSMSLENFPERVRSMLQGVSRNAVEMEQYMDFLRNRMFRQTLLCRADIPFDRTPRPQALARMHVATSARPEGESINPTSNDKVTFRRGLSVLSTSDPIIKSAMLILREAWPESVPFFELVSRARSLAAGKPVPVNTDVMSPVASSLAETFLRCYATSQVDLHMLAPRLTRVVSERPLASPVSRAQAARGSQVTNRHHVSINLDDLQCRILQLLDGTRTQDDLLEEMIQSVSAGNLILHGDGKRITTPEQTKDAVRSYIDPTLRSLAAQALLTE